MSNLFSSFDSTSHFLWIWSSLNWVILMLTLMIFPSNFFLTKSHLSKSVENIMHALNGEILAIFSKSIIPGSLIMVNFFFLFLLYTNILGLIPYVFTGTSHIMMTLIMALPFWLGMMLWSCMFQINSVMAHLVPSGTPVLLMPLMVMIETTSNIIRPGTLAVRLAANMIAGHLLLTLLGGMGGKTSIILLMVGISLLVSLEMAVACIQSYVFTVLGSLYLSEVSSVEFNKKN